MKKGQTQTIFIWIFIAIVAGLIFIFGFKMIKNISETGEDVAVVNFFQKFEKKVNEFYYLDEGSRGDIQLNLPDWVEYVCVRKDGANLNSFSNDDRNRFDNKINVLLNNNEFKNRNVFFVPLEDSSLHMQSIDNLKNFDSICIEVINGLFNATIVNNMGIVNVQK